MQKSFQVGSYAWQIPAWQGSFYPEEMPDEWQLDFYANYFRTVLVPFDAWSAWTEETCEALIESVSLDEEEESFECEQFEDVPPFQFFLWLEGTSVSSEIREKLAHLKSQLGEYLAGIVWYTPQLELEEAQRLRSILPVSVITAFSEEGLYLASESSKPAEASRTFSFALMPIEYTEPKAQRAWVEALLERVKVDQSGMEMDEQEKGLCIFPIFVGQAHESVASPPSPEPLKSLKLLLEFMD